MMQLMIPEAAGQSDSTDAASFVMRRNTEEAE